MKPSKDFSTRYAAAKRWRDAERPYLEDVLSFICPGREHDFSAASTQSYDSDVYISLGEELALDLASDLVTYYCPAETKWAEYLVTTEVPEEQADEVEKIVTSREDAMFDLIQGSNFNDLSAQIMFECAHGTTAMWVDSAHLSMPVHVEVVQPHELLLTPGHLGILDRFRELPVMADTLEALFDGWDVNLSDRDLQNKIRKPGSKVKVCWGFWVDWEDPGNPQWRCEITVDQKRITPEEPLLLGPLAGSCPLLTGRFNPQGRRPWGRGPGRKALPDFRILDKIDEVILNGMDQALHNTLIYPNDGFLDFSDGIEVGKAYPAGSRFDRNQIFELQKGINLDYGFFTEEAIERRIRAAFYQDGPRQRGETPPTATQWVDERRQVQKRLGKPSAPLWTEFFVPFIQRVEYLGVQAGKLQDALTHQGQAITVQPISPLQKAQNQDKVLVARSNLDLAFSVLQDQTATVIDPVATLKNIVKSSGDELTVVRDEQVMNEPPATGQ